LAGQSNMQGFGEVSDPQNLPGTLIDVIQKDVQGAWAKIGKKGSDLVFYYRCGKRP